MDQARTLLNSAHKLFSARLLGMLSCLALVAGATLFLIAFYGGPTPIYDQWDLEASDLYKPYLEGHLGLSKLFAPYNEHRIVFTRVFALALLELRGAWDPIWEMVANIVFRLLAISLLLVLLNRLISGPKALAVALFCALVSATPFTWETILMGYPSNFYFLLMFSFAAFLFLNGGVAWSRRWWMGTLLGVLAYFNVASGMFTLLAADSIICLQIVFGIRRGIRELTGLGLHLVLIILMFLAVPILETNAPVRAQSIAQLGEALAAIAAWPLAPRFWLLLYGPAIIFAGLVVIRRPPFTDDRWSYLMLLTWLVCQFAALAYGRAASPLESRYIDILAVGVVLNFAIILYLYHHAPAQGVPFAFALAACWIVAVSYAGARHAVRDIPSALNYHSAWLPTKTKNIKSFLETNDVSFLAGKSYPDIPYSNSIRLMQLLSDPVIRTVLPSNLVGDDSARQFVQPGTYLRGAVSNVAVRVSDWLLHNGYVFVAVGFACLFLALMRCEWDRNASSLEGIF
jgi:hypothetical protein